MLGCTEHEKGFITSRSGLSFQANNIYLKQIVPGQTDRGRLCLPLIFCLANLALYVCEHVFFIHVFWGSDSQS